MRSSSFLPHLWQYVLSVIVIASITTIFFALRDVLDTTLVALLYLIPLGMITAFWGLGPGITSALITFLTFNYFFIEPYYTFTVHQPTDVVILIVFFIVAVVISQLVGRAQAGLAAATAREREATQLYELSTALTGLHEDRAIAQILTKQVHNVSQGEYVELNITGSDPFTFQIPEISPPSRPPEFASPRGEAAPAGTGVRRGYPRGTPREARNGVWRGTPETARNGVPAGYPWEGPETGPGRPASLSKTPNFAKVVKVGRV